MNDLFWVLEKQYMFLEENWKNVENYKKKRERWCALLNNHSPTRGATAGAGRAVTVPTLQQAPPRALPQVAGNAARAPGHLPVQ